MKKIIVTEKPSVARTYASVLGVYGNNDGYIENDEWIITWCIGHLVTLAYPEAYDESLKTWRMEDLPFLPDRYKYQVISSVKKQFSVIKKIYNRPDVGTIYYAGDSGREGLYIQMLVRGQAGHNPNAEELVVWIDSQTNDEILRGIREAKPLSAYKNLADSGYMRAIEDYALGINFSRALTLKYQNIINVGISVGRVMTCVLGMIVNREREIKNFVPTQYYRIQSVINIDNEPVVATWKAAKNSPLFDQNVLYNESGFKNKEDALNFMNHLGNNLLIEKVESKEEKKTAPLLFNLAELQATCSKVLHISPDETLKVAQSLYEKKMTTYPRTDARVLSSAIAYEIEDNLEGLREYSSEINSYIDLAYTNPKGVSWVANSKYTDDSKITDHYALIPTGQNVYLFSQLSDLEQAVYDLIVRRFVSIFMPPAKYQKLTIVELDESTGERFGTSGSTLVYPGYLNCVGVPSNKSSLPTNASKLVQGEHYSTNYNINEGETKPPSRYNSGSLILAMENAGNLIEDEELRAQIKECGIGTSSTRAETIKKLVEIDYISLNKKTQILTPTLTGFYIYDVVKSSIPALLNPEMTANWEKGLEKIAQGEMPASVYLNKLNAYIVSKVDLVKNMQLNANVETYLSSYKDVIKERKSKGGHKKVEAACYLNVPYEEKDLVKQLGAWWSNDYKCWFVPKGKDTTPFAKWIIQGTPKKVKKIMLKIPYEDKDEAKAAGARWDPDKKCWYALSNMDKNKFSKWL